MKKIFLSLFILISVISADVYAQIEKPIRISIRLDFIIASRRQNCESGFGFCSAGGSITFRSVNTGLYTEGNTLYFCLDRSRISPELESELRNAAFFPVTEETVISQDIAVKLGFRDEIRLAMGNYPITFRDDYIVIPCRIE